MPLQKQPLNLNFAGGLDTKTDPFQVQAGSMLELKNAIFTKGGLLQKRNGYQPLINLPNTDATTLTTYRGSLIAVGSELYSLSQDSNAWVDSGRIHPISLSTLALARSSASQSAQDLAVAANGLGCVTYLDSASAQYFYKIVDSETGQAVVQPTALPSTANMARCYVLGNYFIVTYLATVAAATHLRYIAIPILNPKIPNAPVSLSNQAQNLTAGYDVITANNNLYFAVSASDVGGAIRMGFIDQSLQAHTGNIITAVSATRISVTCDTSSNTTTVWVSYFTGTICRSAAYDQNLIQVLAPVTTYTSSSVVQLTSAANAGTVRVFIQVSNNYSYASIRSDFVVKASLTTAGVLTAAAVLVRSVGLASKAFYYADKNDVYFIGTYAGSYQPTYFLISSSGTLVSKFAYSNGGGYASNQILANVTIIGTDVFTAYLFKTLLVSVNKEQGVSSVGGTYSQTGVNLIKFQFTDEVQTLELAESLNLTGGFLWMYDGERPVEQGFHVWPEDVVVNGSSTGGTMSAQVYYYQAIYEWTDGSGNIHRSAPSIATAVTTTGSTSSVTINVPSLRLTAKASPNPARIVIYRYSASQQSYYQVTSITAPINNNATVDSVTFVDTQSDASIIGNPLLYTTGGVVENTGMSATSIISIFKSRLFCVSSENPNLILYSKQVIQSTPVEMSDLFSIFVAPSISAQGATGGITALSAMDDKLIIFKKNAVYYVTGTGPDNTGASNDFSDPIFITSTVGCTNQKSIVFTPNGLMFQSDKGIWLLGRDLSSQYLGSPVEKFNDSTVNSALTVPGTNQVRFTLNSGVTLFHDYFFGQWGTFVNVPAESSTIYQGLHTYLNQYGRVYQEAPSVYRDGTSPVLMAFTTAWLKLAGLQGYQRFYEMNLLGTYFSPHLLNVQFAYDYNPANSQSVIIRPTNYAGSYGSDSLYGGSQVYGGSDNVEDWQIYPTQQKCEAVSVTVSEIYDATLGEAAGAGLSLSGMNFVVGVKKGYRPQNKMNSAG